MQIKKPIASLRQSTATSATIVCADGVYASFELPSETDAKYALSRPTCWRMGLPKGSHVVINPVIYAEVREFAYQAILKHRRTITRLPHAPEEIRKQVQLRLI